MPQGRHRFAAPLCKQESRHSKTVNKNVRQGKPMETTNTQTQTPNQIKTNQTPPLNKLHLRTDVRAGGLVPATIELGKDAWAAGVKFFNEAILWGNTTS